MTTTEKLVDELTSPNVTELRMREIRDEILSIVFQFKDSSIFDFLVQWDSAVQSRINHNKANVEIPGNATFIISILDLIRQLENKGNQ